MNYYITKNTGEGFLTYADTTAFAVQGFPGDVWVTDGSVAALAWAARIGVSSISKQAAQAAVDAALKGALDPIAGTPITLTLP